VLDGIAASNRSTAGDDGATEVRPSWHPISTTRSPLALVTVALIVLPKLGETFCGSLTPLTPE
jgi:hypothetical protein